MSGNTLDVSLKSQFIRAGAGAGKTTKLIETFLAFVADFRSKNGRFPRVVMTTFTRKATQEVKERLLVSALKANQTDVFEYINRKSFVQISTIHGLLSIFLSQHADRLKFPQEIKVIDGIQYKRNLKKQINSLFKKNAGYMDLLEQYSFVNLVDLAAEALDFKAQHLDFDFCRKEELQKLVEKRKKDILAVIREIFLQVPEVPKGWLAYFDHLSVLQKALTDGNEELFREQVDEFPKKPGWSEKKPTLDTVAHDLILELREQYFKKLFDSAEYIEKHESLNQLFYQFVNELFAQSMIYKRNTGELTIADLETLSVQLLEQFPETAVEFSNSWDYFMIDEYQDTSPLQVRILNRIVQNKPCFIVGDPQQSIYLFRGARSEVFNEKQNQMQAQNAEIAFLETNYRSEPTLMNFINSFFSRFSPQFKPMLTKPETNPERLLSHDAFYISTADQTQAVLTQIRALTGQGVNPQDICVLSRSNSKLTDIAVQAALCGIPVQLQASAGFEEKREILDLISFNRFLNNPHDNENLISLLRSPWFYIADSELLTLSQSPTARQSSLWLAILASDHPQKEHLQKYLQLFDSAGCSQATRLFLTDSSFVSFSAYYDKTGKREANIFKFLISLSEAEKQVGFSLGLFLEEKFLSLQADLGNSNSEAQPVVQPNCVSLMTVHASKGLQFRHVIVIGFADLPQVSDAGRLTLDDSSQKFSLSVFDEELSKHQPSGWTQLIKEKLNEREYHEYERVLYVALTRAIESLTLVFDTEKRSVKKSWFSKMHWPEAGEVAGDGYTALSMESNEPVQAQQSDFAPVIKAREKFSLGSKAFTASQSVTDLLAAKASAGPFNFESGLANLKKAQRGSDLHRLFESLKYLDTKELLRQLSASDQAIVRFLLDNRELDFPLLLKHGNNEWGFGLKTGVTFIQGQIDLWCELENEIHVLDYKTGSSEYSEKAFEQLSFYTHALAGMKVISESKKIIHSVVYPIEQVVKKKEFKDLKSFRAQCDPRVLEIFKEQAPAPA